MKHISNLLTNHRDIQMSKEEKEKTWNVIALQTFSNESETLVRKPILSRLYYRGLSPVLRQQGLSFKREKYAFGLIVGALVVSGTLSTFAQSSLPGDLLYPIKTKVNEKIQVVLAITPEDKAKAEAILATKRLEEAVKLVLLGKVNPELLDQTNKAFDSHVLGFSEQLSLLEKKNDFESVVEVGVFFQTRIAVHAAILKDIEVNTAITPVQKNKEKTKSTEVASIVQLEKKVLSAVVPTVIVTKNALDKLGSTTTYETNEDKKVITLQIDQNEAKDYIMKLHKDIGIPSPLLESAPLPIIPVFVPVVSK